MTTLKKSILLILFLITTFIWNGVLSAPDQNAMNVYFFDVGQGDSSFIETPSGVQMLIDGGPGNTVLKRLGEVMPFGDRSIDIVLLTHPQYDHLSGLLSVLRDYDVGMVVESGAEADNATYEEFENIILNKGISRVVVNAGDRINLGDEIYFDVFAPYKEFDKSENNLNEYMVAGKLYYKDDTFLFTGDMEREDEINLSLSNMDLESDVLKVSHHGSRNSSTELFLEHARPEIAVISYGRENRYGHPHEETISRINNIGAEILRTGTERTIFMSSTGSGVIHKN